MPPVSLLIKPASGHCQYRCRYCFYADEMARRSEGARGIMTRDTLARLVRRAFAASDDYVAFSFQGGEPTLAGLDFFRELIRIQKSYAGGRAAYNSIQTNGGRIDGEWAAFFRENHFLVGLSMDGDEKTHNLYRLDADGAGTFAQTARAAETLAAHGVDFNILCVVNKDVCARPAETYEALRRYRFLQFIPCLDGLEPGAPSFAPDAVSYGRFLIETFDRYERDYRRGQYVSVRTFDNYVQMLLGNPPECCSMAGRCTCSFTVEADGSVYPCDFYAVDEWKLGNVNSDGFGKMAASETARRFVETSIPLDGACRDCGAFFLCRGGCRREREPFVGGKPSIDRYCEGYRLFFRERMDALRRLAERVRVQRRM